VQGDGGMKRGGSLSNKHHERSPASYTSRSSPVLQNWLFYHAGQPPAVDPSTQARVGGPTTSQRPCPMPFAIVLAHTPPLSASSFGQLFAPVTAREKCLVTGDGTGQLALSLVSMSPLYTKLKTIGDSRLQQYRELFHNHRLYQHVACIKLLTMLYRFV